MKIKKTLSNLAESIEKRAEATFKKSEEFVIISKYKIEIASQNELIHDAYSEIGEKMRRLI